MTMVAAPAQDRPRVRRRRVLRWLAVGSAALAIVTTVVLTFLPLITGTAGPAESSFTRGLPVQMKGVYLDTPRGYTQLFPWSEVLDQYPADAPAFTAAAVRHIIVVQNAFDSPEHYVLYRYDDTVRLSWRAASVQGHELLLTPPTLAPGRYLFVSRTDDSFDENSYQYFTVTAASGGTP